MLFIALIKKAQKSALISDDLCQKKKSPEAHFLLHFFLALNLLILFASCQSSASKEDRPFDAGDFDTIIDEQTNELIVNKCPCDQPPKDQKRSEKTGKIIVHFEPWVCSTCKDNAHCPVKIGQRVATYTVDEPEYALAWTNLGKVYQYKLKDTRKSSELAHSKQTDGLSIPEEYSCAGDRIKRGTFS